MQKVCRKITKATLCPKAMQAYSLLQCKLTNVVTVLVFASFRYIIVYHLFQPKVEPAFSLSPVVCTWSQS